ncbi:hypothetical protein SLE2022_189700 [Rubroshorea leprosula]
MAGLLAWAADVVGAHGGNESNEDEDDRRIPIVFTPEQQKYAQDLDQKAASLTRLIQDLRLRLPPSDISQRLPHLHAHSLASNAALTLQLNAHSTTREQTQLREETLQQENAAYERAISNCENKIQEKMHEADSLQAKLKEMYEIEKSLSAELEESQAALDAGQTQRSGESLVESTVKNEDGEETDVAKSAMLDKLEDKKNELSLMEETVRDLEEKWAKIQDKALKLPSPVQREKALDKQLHSLIEQLAAKQAQAEGLVSEIHLKERELERLNALWGKVDGSNAEATTARNRLNRFGRGNTDKVSVSDYSVNAHDKLPYYTVGRNENQQRLLLLRSAFVLYIFILHILVFIKISF